MELDYLTRTFDDLENLKYLLIHISYYYYKTDRIGDFSYSFRNLKKLEVLKLLGHNFKE